MHGKLHAQSNFWSLFGADGCGDYSRMSCNVSPTSLTFSSISNINDLAFSGDPLAFKNHYKNSIYDRAGSVLFSVNANGIYDNSGTQIYSLNSTITTTVNCTSTLSYDPEFLVSPGPSVSEVVTVPMPGACDSYYVMFWANETYGPNTGDAILIAVKVYVDPVSADVSVVRSYVLNSVDCDGYHYYTNAQSLQIAAAALNSDGTRDIYTIHTEGTSDLTYNPKLLRWRITNTGDLPTSPTVIATGLPLPRLARMKIYDLPVSGGGPDRTIAYIARESGPYADIMYTYDINTSTGVSYKAPRIVHGGVTATNHYQAIGAFEYLPAQDIFLFAYREMSFFASAGGGTYTLPLGGLGYAAHAASGTNDITYIASTESFSESDVVRNKHGDLYFMQADYSAVPSFPSYLTLAYIDESDLSSLTTGTPTLPAEFSTTCSSSPDKISILNKTASIPMNLNFFYLGNQIYGEDYSLWGPDIATVYTITTSVTWTPTDNPVATASGVVTSTISSKGIVIAPGGSLTIQDMTIKMVEGSHIDIVAATSGSGGRLVLNNATVTANTGGCDNPDWSTWGGIRVFGHPFATQSSPTTKQGKLTMTNGSVVSYADTAVLTGPPIEEYAAFSFMGGGIVQADKSSFINNRQGVVFRTFSNTDPSTGHISNNVSYFSQCKFSWSDPAIMYDENMSHIAGDYVKGISIVGCDFERTTPYGVQCYGIRARGMGFTADWAPLGGSPPTFRRNTFTGFKVAVEHTTTDPQYTAVVRHSDFAGNQQGVLLKGSYGAVVTKNNFKVPTLPGSTMMEPCHLFSSVPIESIGLNLYTADQFSVYDNDLRYGGLVGFPPFFPAPSPLNVTIGTLAWDVGTANNVIRNNTYKGLGAANLSNYTNRYGQNGLWYKCNSHTTDQFDIAVRGSRNGSSTPSDDNDGDGIRYDQGYPTGTPGFTAGLPAGNTFSLDGYNLYNIASECKPVRYLYADPASGGTPENLPGVPGTTGVTFDASVTGNITMLSTANQCDPGGGFLVLNGGSDPVSVSNNFSIDDNEDIVRNNVSYYMSDSNGVKHRDSLYYWMGELHNAPATRVMAYMLLQDTLVDSALTLYSSITRTYDLDSTDSTMYLTVGGDMFTIQMARALRAGAPTTMNTELAAFVDSMSDSTFRATVLTIAIGDLYTSKGWAKVQVENLLQEMAPMLFDSLMTGTPDTLLYPQPDTVLPVTPSPPGVLTITELSQGAEGVCQYIELLAANCGSSTSPYVDVRGWIINDHSGILTDCDPDAGVDRGHFRLAYDSVWAHIAVGSIIVLYDGGLDCHGLPDTFRLDTFNSVYYIPVGGSGYAHLEEYDAVENGSACGYCSDTGTTVYDTARNWERIHLDTYFDLVEVVCPGCAVGDPAAPHLYHGVGYLPFEYEEGWTPDPMGTNNIGIVIVPRELQDSTGTYRYIYIEDDGDHLLAPTKWIEAGIKDDKTPATLGWVSDELRNAAVNHSLSLPCCNDTGRGGADTVELRHGSPDNTISRQVRDTQRGAEQIGVYPNPAYMDLHFSFPAEGAVTIRLTDVTGRVVAQQVVTDKGVAIINVKGMTAGVYVYQVVTTKGIHTGKVVITE